MPDPALHISIYADDKTAKGIASALKRANAAQGSIAKGQASAITNANRTIGRSGSGLVRTFSSVQAASSKAFGGSSLTSGITSRLGGVTQAASAVGTGLGQVATAGSIAEAAIAGVGVAAAATVGVLAAAAIGAFKLADGFSTGAASMGRLADQIGVGVKAMLEFQAAGERVGVDKDKATGALGGLSQTLNDARYGKNGDALGALAKMGIKLQTNADGTVNTEAMLPAIADAITRQNSSGRRTAAKLLGIPLEALPIFTQGGKQLSADMADADKNAPMLSGEDITIGQRMVRRHAEAAQKAERETMQRLGRAAAGGVDSVETFAIQQFSGSVSRDFAPGARRIDRAGEKMERAANRIGGAPGITPAIVAAAQAAEKKYGVPASVSLAQYGVESGYGRHMPAGSNNPFGIKAKAGEPYVIARTQEVDRSGRRYSVDARFRKFSSIAEAFDAHAELLATGRRYSTARDALPNVDAYADALTGTYATDPAYGRKLKNTIHSQGLDQYDGGGQPIPVKVEVEFKNAPSGTHARVTAGHKPAISHAVQH